MDATTIGIAGFVGLIIILLITGLPVGIGMGVVGFVGILVMSGSKIALNALYQLPYSSTASWLLSVIPMFVLMGYVAFYCGFARDVFGAAYKWVSRLPGGLALTTLVAGAAFGACCGSSVAATAALGKLAIPEMMRYKYNRGLAAGTAAMAGTLSALIPPSILLVLYGVVTETSIGELLIAGILPGLLSMTCFTLLVLGRTMLRPELAPRGEKFAWSEKFATLKNPGVWGIIIIFAAVVGGIYSGIFSPTEAGALGAFVSIALGLVMRRLKWQNFKEILYETLKTTSYIFLIIIGAYIFVRFLALSRLPVELAEWVVILPVPRILIMIAVIIVYLILGCFMDAIGLLLLTVPFMSPSLFALGFIPIQLGIIVVKMLEIGLLTPPVGIQAYVVKGVVPDLTFKDIFSGFLPFFLVDLFVVISLIVAFPQISLFLPTMMK